MRTPHSSLKFFVKFTFENLVTNQTVATVALGNHFLSHNKSGVWSMMTSILGLWETRASNLYKKYNIKLGLSRWTGIKYMYVWAPRLLLRIDTIFTKHMVCPTYRGMSVTLEVPIFQYLYTQPNCFPPFCIHCYIQNWSLLRADSHCQQSCYRSEVLQGIYSQQLQIQTIFD